MEKLFDMYIEIKAMGLKNKILVGNLIRKSDFLIYNK